MKKDEAEPTESLAFSNLDFVIKGKKQETKHEKRNKLTGKDYKSLSAKVQKRREYIEKVKSKDEEKGKKLEQDIKWDTVMNRAQGNKVKVRVEKQLVLL